MKIIASLAAALSMLASIATVNAQPLPSDAGIDPPSRVARLADLNGQVWLYDADAGEWVAAVRNQPVTAGDRLATDPGARAELQLGSTTLRLDSGSELAVNALDDERLSLQLVNGSASARLLDLANGGQFELNTDEGRFVALRAGNYRFDRDGSTSRITVYNGLARYEGPNSGLQITPGQRAEFWIDSGGVAQYALSNPVNDAFAAWNADRDRREVAAVAPRFVSPEMTGAVELDNYGRWEQSPDYGALWIPTAVAVDWAPYRHGHWSWVRPWGWTWIDDAPWGFAPFHYGRWVNVRNTWCWAPGQRVVRPVYAPALVAWVGTPRANVSVTIGGGPPVGWFPLAPREVYVPSYRVSPRYAQNINITNVTNVTVINNVFANPQAPRVFDNRRFPNAVTVVPAGVMTSRQPVAPAAAQWRQNPAAREFINQPPNRAVALIAPPVAAPPVHAVDPRNVRPPPGVAERPAAPRPGFGQQERDRDGRGRDVGRPDASRPPPAVAQQPAPQPANAGERRDDRRDDRRRDAAPPAVASPQAPVTNVPPRPTAAQEGATMRSQPVRREDDRRAQPRPAEQPAPAPAAVTPPRPTVVTPPPRPTAAQEGATMRSQPVRRERDEERRAQPRQPEGAPAANEPRPQLRVERPAPTTQPAPAARAAEPARPQEARPAPEARRPEAPREPGKEPTRDQR